MALTGLYIMGGFLIAILIGLVVYLIILQFKEEKQPEDNTIFESFMPQFSNGFSKGIIDRISQGSRTGIYFYPRDVDYVRMFREKKKVKIEPELVFFENHLLIPLPKGTKSNDRNELWGLPPNPEDLPEALKRTPLGDALMRAIRYKNIKKHEVEIIRGEAERIKDIDRREYSDERLRDYLEGIDESIQDLKKSLVRDERKVMPSLTDKK